jgi:hypothetical protein
VPDGDRHDQGGGPDRNHRPGAPRHHDDWTVPYHGRYQGLWQYLPVVTQVIIGGDRPASMPPIGSVIVGSDNTFLGVISRDVNDPDSISNPYGRFGSPESPYSIWNSSGRWGDPYGQDTPWNSNATRPPIVYVGHTFWGYLSANPAVYPRVDPRALMDSLGIAFR